MINEILEDFDTLIGYSALSEYDGIRHLLIKLKNKVEMSFSDRNEDGSSTNGIKNPAERFYEFKSKKKGYYWYNKETGKEEALSLPAYVIVLDQVHTVGGFSKKAQAGFYSNEVHNPKKEKLYIKTFNKKVERDGFWKEMKDQDILPSGCKYAKNLYCRLISKDEPNKTIAVKLTGSATAPWMDADINTDNKVVVLKDETKEEINGDNTFNVPVFGVEDLTDALIEEAVEEDKKLKAYFEAKSNPVETSDSQE